MFPVERSFGSATGDEMRTSNLDAADRNSLPFPAAHLLGFTLLWLLLAAGTAILFVAVPQTPWHDPVLPTGVRLGLLAAELLALAPASFLVSAPIAALALVRSAGEDGDRDDDGHADAGDSDRAGAAKRGTLYAVAGLVLTAFLVLYLGSWTVFRSTGHFLDSVGMRLWLENPLQLLQHVAHMEPATLVLFPLLVTLGAAAILIGLPRALRRLSGSSRKVSLLSIATLVALLAAVLLPLFGPAGSRLIRTSLDQTGPLVSAGLELQRRSASRDDPLRELPPPALERRPIVSLPEYLAAADTAGMPRRNVIVLIVESLRPDQLLAFGGEREVMPTVEEIAGEGVAFLNHYSQASHSDYADLAPLSSQYPLRALHYHMYPRNITYPRVLLYDILAALGYRTAVFSSQNENWNGMAHYLRTGSLDRFLHADTYEGPTYVPRDDPGFYDFVMGTKRAGKIDDRFTVREAVEWIEEAPERPFFIYMNLQSSHMPYELPADFPPKFGTGEVGFPLRFGYFPPDSAEAVKDLYANSLAYVDAQIAKVVEFLRERGLWEETILVVTGDTGQAFFEHGFAGHGGALYEEVVRVPLVIRAPGVEPRVSARPAQHVDVPPSVLDLLGLPPHPAFQGESLLSGPDRSDRPLFVVGQALADQYAVVSNGYKLIYDAEERRHLLFDLCADPGETRDLVGERPQLVERLSRSLQGWRKIQIEYYADWEAQQRYYPPVLRDAWSVAGVPAEPRCRAPGLAE